MSTSFFFRLTFFRDFFLWGLFLGIFSFRFLTSSLRLNGVRIVFCIYNEAKLTLPLFPLIFYPFFIPLFSLNFDSLFIYSSPSIRFFSFFYFYFFFFTTSSLSLLFSSSSFFSFGSFFSPFRVFRPFFVNLQFATSVLLLLLFLLLLLLLSSHIFFRLLNFVLHILIPLRPPLFPLLSPSPL
jgi:hypothetical protein